MQKKVRGIRFYKISIFLLFVFFLWNAFFLSVQADEPYVVVIDPGHSGENLGAQYDGYTEKEMTMTVALAMKEHLEKFDNIIVYLTHENDDNMSIKDRAAFAGKKNADFLFSLHFNASVKHNLYGAEVWIPAYEDFYVMGRQFAEIEMEEFAALGLYSRGIKTKLNNRDKDYYGILRYCSEEGIPSALIEHCHMDHAVDKAFYQKGEEQLKAFGRADAEAVAKYFGLSSEELSVDYSDYPLAEVESPRENEPVRPDMTPPENCEAELLSIDKKSGKASVRLKAYDSDSYMQYYDYSLDGGQTFSELQKWRRPYWNQSDEEMVFQMQLPLEQEITLVVRAYNGFDGFTESEHLKISPISVNEEEITYEYIPVEELVYEEQHFTLGLPISDKVKLILLIGCISFVMACIFYLMFRMIGMLQSSSKQRKRQ